MSVDKRKHGIETHRWGFIEKSTNNIIATCIATTYWEAVSHFENEDLLVDNLYTVKILFDDNSK